MTPTADDVTVTVRHVWHACNPTDAHRLAGPIEGHAGQNGTESQGRRNVVRKREGSKSVVSFQILFHFVQNELTFGVVKLHPPICSASRSIAFVIHGTRYLHGDGRDHRRASSVYKPAGITIQTATATARASASGGSRPAGSGVGDLGGQSLKGSRETRPDVPCAIAQSRLVRLPKLRLTL